MTPSPLWLLLLFASLLHRAQTDCGGGRIDAPIDFKDPKHMATADAFFDTELCKSGLQWVCYLPRECYLSDPQSHVFIPSETNATTLSNCHAFLAIQPHSKRRWRVVLQGRNVGTGSLLFFANCKAEFSCKADGVDGAVALQQKYIPGFYMDAAPGKEWFGRHEGNTLMCDFIIEQPGSVPEAQYEMKRLTGTFADSGIRAPAASGNNILSFEPSSSIYTAVTSKFESGSNCNIMMKHSILLNEGEEIKPINTDKHVFTCPAGYQMRWMKERESTKADKFKLTTGIYCKTSNSFLFVKNEDGTEEKIRGDYYIEAQCVRKRCKVCQAPACSNPAKCAQIKTVADFDTCAKLECPNKEFIMQDGRPVVGVPECSNGAKWLAGVVEVKSAECTPKCDENVIKTKDPEKFNITGFEVVCKDALVIRHTTEDKEETRLSNVTCITGVWTMFPNTSADAKSPKQPEPYKDGVLDCIAPPAVQKVAQGALVLYAGIALGIIALIVGTILIVCCCLNRKKKKARESELKHKLANANTKSRDSKTASKGTSASKDSGLSSDRSLTGARGKKGGDKSEGPAIPDEKSSSGPKQPDPRSKPASGSSITKTSELQKLQDAEEKRKAAAALLETSRVEEEPPTDTPIDSAVLPKGGQNLDGTQPTPTEQTPTPVPAKPRVKRRPKKAVIMDSNEPPRAPDNPETPPPLKRILTPKPPPVPVTPVVANTQPEEPEQPLWNNQPAAAPVELVPAATPTADSQTQDELKTSREKERDAGESRKKKIADMPTAKKKESAKKVKSNKTPKAELYYEKYRPPSLLRPGDLASDKSSSKKGEKGSAKKKRWADEPKIDETQHKHVHGTDGLGCGPLCAPIPKSQTDSGEEN